MNSALLKTLLLVDDEVNVLASLNRLFRSDGYEIIRASSGAEGLQILSEKPVSVVITDQRMPTMTGVEFLRKVREHYPNTVRIVLSGYTDLKSVTDAINEGAIYKFMTKPWDDQELRMVVAEAFDFFETMAKHDQHINQLLIDAENASQHMQNLMVHAKYTEQLSLSMLTMVQEMVELIPVPLLGINTDLEIVLSNMAAVHNFGQLASPGANARNCLPDIIINALTPDLPMGVCTQVATEMEKDAFFQFHIARLGRWSAAQGYLVILMERQP